MSKRILFILVVLALAWSTMADVQAKSKKEGRFSGQTAKQVGFADVATKQKQYSHRAY